MFVYFVQIKKNIFSSLFIFFDNKSVEKKEKH